MSFFLSLHFQLASPQTSFGIRLSRIHFSLWGRNECVTNEPQRTSAGRLIFSVFWIKKILKSKKKKTVTIQVLKINQGTKFEIWLFFHCLKLLFNVLLVRLHKYGHAGKQGSKSVAPCFGFYGTQVRLQMISWAHNQKSSFICDQLVVNFEPDPLRSSISLKLFTDKLLVFKRSRAQVQFFKMHRK